jgi:hypothetical protein
MGERPVGEMMRDYVAIMIPAAAIWSTWGFQRLSARWQKHVEKSQDDQDGTQSEAK